MNLTTWLKSLNPFSRKSRSERVLDLIRRLPTHHNVTEQLKERTAISPGGTICGTINNTSLNTGNGMNMGVVRRARAFAFIGTIPGGGNVNFKLQASATSGGTYADITTLTTNPTITGCLAGLSAIEMRADMMPAGKPWLRAILTETGSQTVTVDLILLGDEVAYKPGNQFNTGTALINDLVAAV